MKKLWTGIVAVGLLSSCQQVQGWLGMNEGADSTQTLASTSLHKAKLLRDESITAENAYSDLFLDSAAVEAYISQEKISSETADQIRAFYLVRNNQFAWFTSEGVTEQARGLWSMYESKRDAKPDTPDAALGERMDSLLTRDSAFISLRDASIRTSDTASVEMDSTGMSSTVQRNRFDTTVINTELALTAQFVALMSEPNSAINADNFFWMVPRKKMDPMQLADSLLHKGQDSALGQHNTQYAVLKQSLKQYYEAANNGNWQPIAGIKGLKQGAQSPAVAQLKKRLALTGNYPVADSSTLFSDSLALAIRNLQEQYGQLPTGQVSDSLLMELNVPAQQRVQQILVNMNRALWLPTPADSSRIAINIPAQELVVYSDTGRVMTMPVIVGKEGTSTIAFNDQVSKVVFSPYWNIPQSIVREQIMPAMKANPNYLKENKMEIVRQNDSIPEIRQLPGQHNALGQVKFLFPNSFDIYLHDTPNKDLFAQQNRALSNGCIRVAYPDSLARYILRGQPEWTTEKIRAAMNSGQEQQVTVTKPVPVSITYYTAWTSPDGRLHFRNDLYGYDRQTASRMFTRNNSAVGRTNIKTI